MMGMQIWHNISFRLCVIWIDLVILTSVLLFHSYRLCYLHKDRKGSAIRIFKFISFKHLSFIVIISALLPALQQAYVYTPQQSITNGMCQFTLIFGITCLSFAKLALHLFVAVRSQIVRNETSSIWFKIGLAMIISDVLYIVYIVSGVPIIRSMPNDLLCPATEISLPVYVWFAMNDFVIGCYCLFAFIVPLRKYVLLEGGGEIGEEYTVTNEAGIQKTSNSELKTLITRIMIYSSIALVSTMITSVASAVVHQSGGTLFGIDSVINAVCVIFQFSASDNNAKTHGSLCRCHDSERKLSKSIIMNSNQATRTPETHTNHVSMVIHDHVSTVDRVTVTPEIKAPELGDSISLSLSLGDDEDTPSKSP